MVIRIKTLAAKYIENWKVNGGHSVGGRGEVIPSLKKGGKCLEQWPGKTLRD